jgi:hypothetical protein
MAEHFLEQYGKRARYFVYNSKAPHNLESFSSDSCMLSLRGLALNVKSIHDFRSGPYLADLERKKLTYPKPGSHPERHQRPIAEGIATLEAGQCEFQFLRR